MSKETMNASELMLRKIASRDAAACLLVKQAALMKTSGIGQWLSDAYAKAKGGLTAAGQATKDYFMDVNNIKDLGIGAATAAGTYGLSGLIPGADKARGYRLLASLAAGTGATIYGDEIRGGAQDLWDKTPWGKQQIAADAAAAQALAEERAAAAKGLSDRDASIANLGNQVNDLTTRLKDRDAEVAQLNGRLGDYRTGINNADLGGTFVSAEERRTRILEAIRAAYQKRTAGK